MAEIPVIVISSTLEGTGKTTLTLNLAAAFWADGYEVGLIASKPEVIKHFISKRQALNAEKQINLPMPKLLEDTAQMVISTDKKQVIIADIDAADIARYAGLFQTAHTLITVTAKREDIAWPLNHPYANLIWQAKKSAAARGIKYLNWIVVRNQLTSASDDFSDVIAEQAKRFGFRIAEPLRYREAFCHINEGYCAADMVLYPKVFAMTMADVYARREILTLTDFLWQS